MKSEDQFPLLKVHLFLEFRPNFFVTLASYKSKIINNIDSL